MSQANIPLVARINLSHAYFQNLANSNYIDLLHIKGYAFGLDTYTKNRQSSDVDILVRPAHVDRLMYILENDGWMILTSFDNGSIFEHASTIYHPTWGLADIHKYFPGIGFESPASTFEEIWRNRRTKIIANFPCLLPSVVDSRLIVIVHGARSILESHPDIEHLKNTLEKKDWEELRDRSVILEAKIAFDTALGNLEVHKDDAYYLIWKSISQKVPFYVEWKGRLRRKRGIIPKIKILWKIILINEDHLAMSLGRKPTRMEKIKHFFYRFDKLKFWI